ncbi:YggS family pyridoxal phosphate enzyme [Thermaurantimonas aggregans]|uniref:Pyridoxal phosphate homeostasis protein n=1 Tax=Thermaurantimonas aggregans TaxID=2173829 RepID=A0A401XNA8_9FLAO|nr:YggS family pyridoxal phosphate-dependent enzyme [Thermaurantimonas aggregans]MCX8149625.1 YggS family pyridoxal phosphate-dependent enzyme [Thermaurantimonas aggregans]GCD78507.1 YggS family pyridoxal phosphate enzyme [Thermaurantimonas aggregans]
MSAIAENLARIRSEIGQNVTLVAVSKFKSPEQILEAYHAGHRDFGENRVQELVEKAEKLPKDIRWHMIGHLQTNKVKYITPFIHLIHSIDSEKLLTEVQKQALRANRSIDILLQVFIADEPTKFGLDDNECLQLAEKIHQGLYPNVRLRGLMGMATNTDDASKIESEFRHLKSVYDQLCSTFPTMPIDTLSMGMSGDYPIALRCGSNMIRVGSAIFGAR